VEAEGLERGLDDKPREKDRMRVDAEKQQCADNNRGSDRRDD
jgi:hypothetical protein